MLSTPRLAAAPLQRVHIARLVPLALLWPALLWPGLAQAQFDPSAYPEVSMSVLLKRHAELLAQAKADPAQPRVDDTPQRYRVLVTFRGERRAMADNARALIKLLSEEQPQVPRSYLDYFRQEIGVDADGRTYWMPVRAQLVPFVDTEIAGGDPIYVYAVFIGAVGPRPVLLVNEFKKAQMQ